MKTTEDSIKTVIDALFSGLSKETLEDNREVYEKLKVIYSENPNMFLDVIEMGYHDFNSVLDAVFEIPEQDNKYILEYIINGTYEHFHRTRIEKLEGSACCADKSSFIKSLTLKALKQGTNISLYADYTNIDQIKEDKERQAYWSPISVKDTDEAMDLFWKWWQLSLTEIPKPASNKLNKQGMMN